MIEVVAVGIITLVSSLVAKEGYVFQFTGAAPECMDCPFRRVCVDKLKPGHVYRVVKVLGIKNKCRLTGSVTTVEVEEAPARTAVPSRLAVEGMVIRFSKVQCDRKDCPYYSICRQKLLPESRKVKIVSVGKKIKCPRGLHLREVDVLVAD